MAANRIEAAKGDAGAANAVPAGAPEEKKGGLGAWLPLILNILLMPALAYGTAKFLIIPKLQQGAGATEAAAPAEAGGEHAKPEEHGKPAEGKSEHGGGKEKGLVGGKMSVPLSAKILVNVAGTMGTRYLLANVILVGANAEFKDKVANSDAQLRDVAANALSNKTIADLERPGARNLIRAELISVFNSVLGDGSVNDLYLTDFAIQ